MKNLGSFLNKISGANFAPYFVIQEDIKIESSRQLPISEQCIINMMVQRKFEMDRIRIKTSKQLSTTTISLCLQEDCYPYSVDSYLPISGFPRSLMTEDTIQSKSPPVGCPSARIIIAIISDHIFRIYLSCG